MKRKLTTAILMASAVISSFAATAVPAAKVPGQESREASMTIDGRPVKIGHAEISGLDMELGDDDSVRVSFNVATTRKDLPATRTFVLRLKASNGATEKPLRLIRVERPYKELKDRRQDILTRSPRRVSPDAAIYLKAGDSLTYTETWKYEPWMSSLSLGADSWYEGCCDKMSDAGSADISGPQQIYFPPVYYSPLVAEVPVPKFLIEEMAEKNSFISASRDDGADRSAALAFQFNQGSSALDLGLSDNTYRMSLVNDALKAIMDNPDVRLRKVIMTGYASVEGSRALNERLAKERAEAVLAGIEAGIRPDRSIVEIVCGGEDWEDLLKQVQMDKDVPQRDSVLSILTKEPDTEVRKVMLRNLPRSYRYLLDEIFPRQRSAGYLQLFFDVINRSDINQRIAIRFNEAAAAAEAGNYDEALAILEKRDLPLPEAAAQNLRGVCLWQKGELEEAEACFVKALELEPGMEAAARNLGMIREWDKYHHLQEVQVVPAG